MYPLHFISTAILSSDEQSLAAGLVVSFLFYLNYRRLQQQVDKEEMLERFLKSQ